MSHFADTLATAVRRCGSTALVGLDPRIASLPSELAPGGDRTPAEAYRLFCREIIDIVAPYVPAVKPQAAFFEELGPAGMTALADVIAYARSKSLLVILDGKRNDIDSTAAAYASAYLGAGSAWGADALTVSPYLGDDSLQPFVDASRNAGAGIFVLVKTSNPGGGAFQDLTAGGRKVYDHVAATVERLAAEDAGECGYGPTGAVVGATYPEQLAELRKAMPHVWILVPGYGAQGGGAADVAGAFDANGLGAIVNSSRGIIFAHTREPYASEFGDARWREAVEASTRNMVAALNEVAPVK